MAGLLHNVAFPFSLNMEVPLKPIDGPVLLIDCPEVNVESHARTYLTVPAPADSPAPVLPSSADALGPKSES